MPTEHPTLQDWLRRAAQRLSEAGSDSPHLDAQILLGHALDRPRSYLYAHGDDTLEPAQRAQADALLARRLEGRPVAHLLGRREFWSQELEVSPDTLIPRPETEITLELALEKIPSDADWALLDLGTGSGALALMLARERPGCRVTATDNSAAALAVARRNCKHLGVSNLELLEGDWFAPLAGRRFRLIVSNPPYVAEADPHLQAGDVRFEPRGALAAGPAGLDDLRRLIAAAPDHLEPGGWLVLEHGFDQAEAVDILLKEKEFYDIECRADLAGRPRATAARHAGGD
ncbi:peptide chain release factor N(5)-glutamine methyltransferase [Thiohalobacter thiocyanaticus]|uniref:Release factor glutamine methyltransferase n=1 Tax=Thiohalobacter thiocyanaticus TaxID=585455 RepID=A0A426QKV6_9GAMM|nr:peptide chain release factor N(5)-glutamine methyltransferase [Thiohalobacter thiocyanaticus]RRQ22380.1 peptide chain release factor N(5)-glutamine methyltransferase [Thiohalobacter thiocyanaticus]